MRSLNINEIVVVSGGDNDGNAGEAEARRIMENTGGRPQDCDIYGYNGSVYYNCRGADGGSRIGNFYFDDDGDEDEEE